MSYLTLKSYEDEQGRNKSDYVVEGTFEAMLYLCLDVYRDQNIDGQIVDKPREELTEEYRSQLSQLYQAVGPLLDGNYIKDYWLVITPRICDSGALSYSRPERQDNFIVLPFNFEEIDLVENLIIPSDVAGATVWLSENKRKRLATNSILEVYVAVQLNDEHPDFYDWNDVGRGTSKHSTSLLKLSLAVCEFTLDYMTAPLRTFIQYGTRQKSDSREPVFVEQYFDVNSRPTKGYRLGEGYIRGVFKSQDSSKLSKYMAFRDLFESRGNDFCNFALSLEDLIEQKKRFREEPWVKITYNDD